MTLADPVQTLGLPTLVTPPALGWPWPFTVEARRPTALDEPVRTALQESYESGGIVLFPKPCLPISPNDWAFLDSLPAPRFGTSLADNRFKKAKIPDIMGPWKPGHVLDSLGFDAAKAERFQGIVTQVNERLRRIAERLFPTYAVVHENITWRLTETGPEEMHYDWYGYGADDLHNVRVFVNLDSRLRKWAIGPPIWDAIRQYPATWMPHRDLHPNRINDKISQSLPWSEMARGEVDFAPGALWLVNSQIVAHEIVWGRKMVAATFKVDPKTMADPKKNFVDVVRKAMAAATCEQQDS